MSLSLAQHASGTGTASATATIATPTPGDLLIVSIEVLGNVANITPPTGYTLVDTANLTTVDGCRMYYRIADGTESTSCTATCTAASAISIEFAEYASTNGAFQAGCLDQHAATTNTGAASLASGSITPTTANFVLASCLGTRSTTTTGMAVSNGLTIEEQQRGTRDDYADLLVSGGSGAYSTTWSWTAGTNLGAACIIANFTEPAAPSGITPTGIASGEAFGQSDGLRRIMAATGIATGEVLGADKVRRVLAATGVVTGESVGTGDKLTRVVLSTAVVSGEAFGQSDKLVRVLVATGIVSGETLGSGDRIMRVVLATGVTSGEAFGQADKLVRVVSPTAIAPAETFGLPTLTGGVRSVSPSAIASGELFGSPTVTGGVQPSVPIGAYVAVSDGLLYSAVVADSAVMYVLVSDSLIESASISDGI